MSALRSSGVIGPSRAEGGRTMQRSTIDGVPLPSRKETSASPLPSSMMILAVVELGIGTERFRRRLHRLLIAGGEGPQRVLHAIAELGEHLVRYVERILRHEIDADPLRADQADHLLDLIQQRLRRVGEQKMRLIEEEAKLGFGLVADLGQLLEQLGEEPQEKRGIEARIRH